MEKALEISTSDLNLVKNDWYKDVIEEVPDKVVCFPYAQHFISDTPGHRSLIKNKVELIESIRSLDLSNIKTFSVSQLRDLILFQNIITIGLLLAVILLLVL